MPIVAPLNVFAKNASPPDKRTVPVPLSHPAFSFDSVAVAGFFGGDSAVAGMATANLIPGRRWVGWYNNPGSYEIAKRYGPLGKAKLIDGLFPDGEHNPARLFKLDGREGPPFIGAHSGTVFQRTGHLAHLITSKAADMDTDANFEGTHGRATTSPGVTIVNMQHVPELGLKESSEPRLPRSWKAAWSVVPIAVSIGACVGCGLVHDWFCLASITVGIAAHGFACYVIGSGKLTFTHPKPAANAPAGDGVLKGDREWVILLGSEGVVNAFTRGRFRLQYGAEQADKEQSKSASGSLRRRSDASTVSLLSQTDPGDHPSSPSSRRAWIPPQSAIGVCAVFLMVQFIGQLLIIPHGTLFGQIMFIATVLASWTYNTYLSSIDRDKLQMEILSKELHLRKEHMHKYELNTFTAAVAFACFVLAAASPLKDPLVFLDSMLPNNTAVWKAWKLKMAEKLRAGVETKLNFTAADLRASAGVEEDTDRELLQTLFDDAEDAWLAWFEVRGLVFSPRAAHRELRSVQR